MHKKLCIKNYVEFFINLCKKLILKYIIGSRMLRMYSQKSKNSS